MKIFWCDQTLLNFPSLSFMMQPVGHHSWSFSNWTLMLHVSTANFTASKDLVISARVSLSTVLSTPNHPDPYKTMCALWFLARHDILWQHFIGHDEVIGTLMHALEWTMKCSTMHLFLLIMDTLCSIVENSEHEEYHHVHALILYRWSMKQSYQSARL